MNVADIIARASFDEHDRDVATSGLCGTFALALFDALTDIELNPRFALACVGPLTANPEKLIWRHALVSLDGRLFDIEGEVLAEHVLDNYCWRAPVGERSILTLGRDGFIKALLSTRGAFDAKRSVGWGTMIREVIRSSSTEAVP